MSISMYPQISKEHPMKSFSSYRLFGFVLAAVTVLAFSTTAQAVARPHHSRGTAQFTQPGFVGAGNATHLGAYTEVGSPIQLPPTADPAVFDATATSTYTAANGDKLFATF